MVHGFAMLLPDGRPDATLSRRDGLDAQAPLRAVSGMASVAPGDAAP